MSGPSELLLRQPSEDTLTLILSGRWKLGERLPSAEEVGQKVESDPQLRQIAFDTEKLAEWDTGLLTFLTKLRKLCSGRQIRLDGSGLPDGARQLLALAAAVPEKKDARKSDEKVSFLTHLGDETVGFFQSGGELLGFVADASLALWALLHALATAYATHPTVATVFPSVKSTSGRAKDKILLSLKRSTQKEHYSRAMIPSITCSA